MDSRKYLSLGLIIIGIVWFLSNQNYIPGYLLFYVISVGFLGAYLFIEKSLRFLLPATNIAAIAIFSTLIERIENLSGGWLLVLLGISSLAVYLVHTLSLITLDKRDRIWLLFNGAIFSMVGLFILIGTVGEKFLQLLSQLWPIALVLAGLLLLFMKKKVK